MFTKHTLHIFLTSLIILSSSSCSKNSQLPQSNKPEVKEIPLAQYSITKSDDFGQAFDRAGKAIHKLGLNKFLIKEFQVMNSFENRDFIDEILRAPKVQSKSIFSSFLRNSSKMEEASSLGSNRLSFKGSHFSN